MHKRSLVHNHHHRHKIVHGKIEHENENNDQMTKREKIITIFLAFCIVLFIGLTIVLFISRSKEKELPFPTAITEVQKKAMLTPYPTLPPIQNMTVVINARRFVPQSFTIPKGGYVDFLNIGPDPVTIVAGNERSSILNIGEIKPNSDKGVKIDESGIYTFRNKEKPEMLGIITVK